MKKIILTVILCWMLAVPAVFGLASGQRVFDKAGLLSSSEEESLEQLLTSYIEETRTDLVILTTDDAEWKTSEAYADDFYDNGNFGYDGPQGTGVLFLIDMDNREIYISTCGDAIYYMTDSRIDAVLDACYNEVVDADYYGACREFLSMTRRYLLQDPYAKPTLADRLKRSLRNSPVYLIVSALIGLIAAGLMKRSAAYRNTTNYTTYQDQGNFHLVQREDFFLRETTTRQKIYRDEGRGSGSGGGGGSSTHISSGGVTHGGGGRKF